jgi:hypothetical protein
MKRVRPATREAKAIAHSSISSLLSSQSIARVSDDHLVPTAKGRRLLKTHYRPPLTSSTVKCVDERESWLDSPLGGHLVVRPTRIQMLRTEKRRIIVEPMQTARRLYVEAAVVHSPKLEELLVNIRTKSSEFRRDERSVMFDLSHAESIYKWLGRVLKKTRWKEKRNGRK